MTTLLVCAVGALGVCTGMGYVGPCDAFAMLTAFCADSGMLDGGIC